MADRVVAAIDCGTNSTRLLVARLQPDGMEKLVRRTRITRLGEGVDATGRLGSSAIDRVVECLVDYRLAIDEHGIDAVRMTATSAARDASNRDEFFDAVEAVVGARPELLSGEEEGRLSFIGATSDLDPALAPFLVVDIGGGSTEFAYGDTECKETVSTDMGCVRLSEKYIDHDPSLPEELLAALSIVELHLDDVVRTIPEAPAARTLVCLSGTASAAAAIEQGVDCDDRAAIHHFELTKEAAEDVFRTVATETRAERLANPGMEEGRADVIVGGMCVVVRIMRQFGFASCLVSECDLLEGLALSLR